MRKLKILFIAVFAISVFALAMPGTASAQVQQRGYGMSVSDWVDTHGQAAETSEGIIIGADASLKLPLDNRLFSTNMQFVEVPQEGEDFWALLTFSAKPEFNGWTAVHFDGSVVPDNEVLVLMLMRGAENKLTLNMACWTLIDDVMTLTPIALGDNPMGLGITDKFGFEIKLNDGKYEITFSTESDSHTYSEQTHAALAAITTDTISNSYGEMYLSVTSFAAAGGLKRLEFSNFTTHHSFFDSANWKYSGTPVFNANSIEAIDNIRYAKATDASSGYIRIRLNLDAIITTVDAWVGIGLTKVSDYPQNNPEGLKLLLRNQGGKLFVAATTGNFGSGTEKLYDSIDALGDFLLEIEEDGEGIAKVTINREPLAFESLNTLKFSDFTDAGGRTYLGFGSFVAGTSTNKITIKQFSTEIRDKEKILMDITGVPESGTSGKAVTLPEAVVTHVDGDEVTVSLVVVGPDGSEVTVTDSAFIPESKGLYKATYTATDGDSTISQSYDIIVVDLSDALKLDSIKDRNNWHAPWGGIAPVDSGMSIFAHSYYKLPVEMVDDAVRVTVDIKGLWDTQNTEIGIDAWVSVAFTKRAVISAPGGYDAGGDGLYVRFNNVNGRLATSVTGFSVFGEEIVAISDMFADKEAFGEVTIEMQKFGDEGVALFVNGIRMMHENMSKLYYSDIVNEDNCTYIGFSAYDNDDADILKHNTETRFLYLTGIDNEKTEIIIDVEKPEIAVTGVPESGKVGERIQLPTATVTDNVDTELTANISVKDGDNKAVSVVNSGFTPLKAGTYTVMYTAVDSSGNEAETLTFTITVTGDTTQAPKDSDTKGCKSYMGAASMFIAATFAAVAMFAVRKRKI